MRGRTRVLGSSPCRVGGLSRGSSRTIIALAAALCCLGWLSSVAVATVVCDEESTYCRDVNLRCTYSGQGQNCCAYTCAPDESCTAEEQQPLVECAPPEVYVHRNLYSGAPGCVAVDGQTTVINQSDFYWYKFSASTTADSQIWGCNDCQVTTTDEDQQVAPRGHSGYSWSQGVSFPSETSGCECSAFITSGCCDNCPSEYAEEPECVNNHCNLDDPCHTGQVCASVTSNVQFIAWSKNGTSWISYSTPKTVPVTHFTSACAKAQGCN